MKTMEDLYQKALRKYSKIEITNLKKFFNKNLIMFKKDENDEINKLANLTKLRKSSIKEIVNYFKSYTNCIENFIQFFEVEKEDKAKIVINTGITGVITSDILSDIQYHDLSVLDYSDYILRKDFNITYRKIGDLKNYIAKKYGDFDYNSYSYQILNKIANDSNNTYNANWYGYPDIQYYTFFGETKEYYDSSIILRFHLGGDIRTNYSDYFTVNGEYFYNNLMSDSMYINEEFKINNNKIIIDTESETEGIYTITIYK